MKSKVRINELEETLGNIILVINELNIDTTENLPATPLNMALFHIQKFASNSLKENKKK